jgi:peroxiredoxin
MRSKRKLIFGIIIGLVVGFLFLFFVGERQKQLRISEIFNNSNEQSILRIGSPAPDFKLETLNGWVRLSELHGKVVLINFWATWCGPCTLEMPLFQQFYEENLEDLVVLAVNGQDTLEDIRTYTDELGLTFDVLIDKGGKIHGQYLVRGFPTTIIVDRKGIVQFQHIGIINEFQLVKYLEKVGL